MAFANATLLPARASVKIAGRRDRRGRRHERAGAHTAKTEQTTEGRENDPVFQPCYDTVHLRLHGIGTRLRDVELLYGGQTAVAQVLEAAQLVLRVVEIGARFGERGLLFLVRELDQDAALLDVVAVLEVHTPHRIADLGRQRHGFVGLGGTERFDHVVDLIAAHGGGRDQRSLLCGTAREPAGRATRGAPAARHAGGGTAAPRRAAVVAVARQVPNATRAEREGNHNEQRVLHWRSILGLLS